MLLRTVRLANFRGLRSARVSFDPTTVLIGENDCGRSSIMEAVALALGWNANACEFLFQPFHLHRSLDQGEAVVRPISIELEFSETVTREWDGEGFELLRDSLPDVLSGNRSFWFEVTHDAAVATHWSFRSVANRRSIDDRALLAWLRRRMPVFWMSEGMMAASHTDASRGLSDERSQNLAEQVSRNYRDLLEGTAPDVAAAIERGSAAARRLLLDRAKLVPGDTTPLREVLEEITGKRRARPAVASSEPSLSSGTAAHKIGLLVLVGALLRSGAGEVEQARDSLTLIENPEAHLHPMTLASIWSVIDRIEGQKIIATHSETLLGNARLSAVRRLTRHAGYVRQWRVPDGSLTADELRRYSYHVRSRRGGASFARCWLLVEGETEFWIMGELARICGYDFASEGVACVEFAQCGLSSLLKVARHLGIEWYLLTDGDPAGQQYEEAARRYAGETGGRITVLREVDVERCFWRCGYEDVFRTAAYPGGEGGVPHRRASARSVIARAIERYSKPYVAALLLDAVADRGVDGVPPQLRQVIEACVRMARQAPAANRS
jgi:putative ATP-dependent endonuclease of OLD family